MKLVIWFVAVLATSILWSTDGSLAQCPEDPDDNGICDTLHVGVFPPDTLFTGPGHLVRVPIFVTHDVPNPNIDSIPAMSIPLCYTHTNPAKYCSLSRYWNPSSFSGPSLPRSVFRHLVLPSGDTLHNWMLRQKEMGDAVGEYWVWTHAFLFVDLPSQCWLELIAITQPLFGEGSRVLLATMTFRVEDTMSICLDSCHYYSAHLLFSRMDAVAYIPRDNMPYCFSISYPQVGDVTADGKIDLGDVVYLKNYLYRGGPAPNPVWLGDVTCNGIVDLGDVVFLTNYLYKGGPAPPC